MPRKTDKRERLVQAAKNLMHQQGFNLTTLADIAQEAGVPLGNVYYYFKTKEAIGEAVIEGRQVDLIERLDAWEKLSQPMERLANYVHFELESLDATARFGCPIGGLCQELAKQGGPLADSAAKLLHRTIEWAETQFSLLNFSEEKARYFAVDFIGRVQGMALLTNTFKDPSYASAVSIQIHEWLKQIAAVAQKTGALA